MNKSKHETLSGKGYFDCSAFTKAINLLNSTPQALYWFSLMRVCYIYSRGPLDMHRPMLLPVGGNFSRSSLL